MKIGLKITFKAYKALSAIILIVILVVISLFVSPVFSTSELKCSSCHGSYYNQQLKFLEGSNQNSIPSSIQVGQTLNVTVELENVDDASRYFLLSDVSVSLMSKNNHFSANSSTFNIETMAPGTATANWQITGTSSGSDELIITVTGVNHHGNVFFSDQYSPNPSITIEGTASSTPTMEGTPQPTPQATTSPTTTPANSPTLTTTPIPTPTVPELPALVVLPLFILALFVVATVKHPQPPSMSK